MHPQFPEEAYYTHPTSGKVVVIRRGEKGYAQLVTSMTADELNVAIGVSREIAKEMYQRCLFGWPKDPESEKVENETDADHSPEALSNRYGVWGEHEHHLRCEWKEEVRNDDTTLGYWEWVSHRIEEGLHDTQVQKASGGDHGD